ILYVGDIITYVFFFQAEDGIRDKLVTGVQTCALPISPLLWNGPVRGPPEPRSNLYCSCCCKRASARSMSRWTRRSTSSLITCSRSEERRVGKECRSRWWQDY